MEMEKGFTIAVAGFLPKDKDGFPFISSIESKKRLGKVVSDKFFELRPSDQRWVVDRTLIFHRIVNR